ncbi:nucleoside monophosphate kinase, partial [Bacillus mycoides]|uniref:nucleoside monophosphate kinase n=1 Tax=Bacillus mycoides TaxID=1405 RepID=UPI003CC7D91B
MHKPPLLPHQVTIPILPHPLTQQHSIKPFLLHPFPPTLPQPSPLQHIIKHLRKKIHYLLNINLHSPFLLKPLTPPPISKHSPP